MKYLKVYATPEEIEHLKHCASMPVMAITNPAPPGPGVPHAIPMCESPLQAAHRIALAHGLPEIPGYYGCDLQTGEFVSV